MLGYSLIFVWTVKNYLRLGIVEVDNDAYKLFHDRARHLILQSKNPTIFSGEVILLSI